jgi:hypothetical protein
MKFTTTTTTSTTTTTTTTTHNATAFLFVLYECESDLALLKLTAKWQASKDRELRRNLLT